MTSSALLEVVPNLIAGGVLLVGLTFAIVYARFSDWRLTSPGRALMYLIICFDALIMMNTVHLAVGEYGGRVFVRLFVYVALLWSMSSLLLTLINILRDGRPITLWAFVIPRQTKADA